MPQVESTLGTLTKPATKSLTIWGGAIALGAGIAGLFGYHIDPAIQANIVDLASSAVSVVGGAIAIYGRIKATHVIK